MGLRHFIILGRPVSRIRLTTTMGHPGILAFSHFREGTCSAYPQQTWSTTTKEVAVVHLQQERCMSFRKKSKKGACLTALVPPARLLPHFYHVKHVRKAVRGCAELNYCTKCLQSVVPWHVYSVLRIRTPLYQSLFWMSCTPLKLEYLLISNILCAVFSWTLIVIE